jgi:hypothetical protein
MGLDQVITTPASISALPRVIRPLADRLGDMSVGDRSWPGAGTPPDAFVGILLTFALHPQRLL